MLVKMRDTILDFVDRARVDDFIHQMRDRGMTLRLVAAVSAFVAYDPGGPVTLSDGRKAKSDSLLYAAGRTGNVGQTNLDAVGIMVDRYAVGFSHYDCGVEMGRFLIRRDRKRAGFDGAFARSDVMGQEPPTLRGTHPGRRPTPHAPESWPVVA